MVIEMSLSVRPIPYGLRRDELVFEIIKSLDELQIVAEITFKKIDDRIASFGQTFADITHRTNVCISKVNQLKSFGTKASKVFSSHKYPKYELTLKKTYYHCIDNEVKDRIGIEFNQKSVENDLNNNSKRFGQHIPFDELLIDNKMKLLSESMPKISRKIKDKMNSRIGSIDWNRIQSLSSLMIFNTSEIAFINRSLKTSESRSKLSSDTIDSGKRTDLMSAPTSINTPVEDINQLHYGFGLGGGAPQMDSLPMALPSLPGIADEFAGNLFADLPMNTDLNSQSILPNALPALPNFDITYKQMVSSITDSKNVNKLQSLVPPPPPPPLPPPPPPTECLNVETSLPPIRIPPPPPILPIILPPPPPPPNITITSPKSNLTAPPMPMSADSGRASLLESIRMAGGKPKMKTVKERKIDEKIKKKEKQELGTASASKSSGGGDLMSDLMKRLALRRDGISGNSKVTPSETRSKMPKPTPSAMDRVSAMIPAPINESGNEDSSPDEDWVD